MRVRDPNAIPVRQGYTDAAYHGTSAHNLELILTEGFRPSDTRENWYGSGVYFFEGSYSHARKWARDRFGDQDARVLKARVDFGKCLDLLEAEFIDVLTYFKQQWQASQGQGRALTNPMAINMVSKRFGYDTVRGVNRPRNVQIIQGLASEFGIQIIICVKNVVKISNVKEVRGPYE